MAARPSRNVVSLDKIAVVVRDPMVTVIRKSKTLNVDSVLFPEVFKIIMIEIYLIMAKVMVSRITG